MPDAFRTKAGRCVLDGEALRFERRDGGPLGTLGEALTGEDVPTGHRVAVAVLAVALLGVAVLSSRLLPAWLVTAGAVGLVAWAAWYLREGLPAPADGPDEIPLEAVVGVDRDPGVPLLSRPRFVVRFRDEGGVKHRVVTCPSRLFGFPALERGTAFFEDLGLLTTEDPTDAARATAQA